MILGIDTSAGQCAVAVGQADGTLLAEAREPMARGHAEHLMPMIERVMADVGLCIGEIARIGVCTGPGSFTGVRIGVAAARGLAFGLGVPAIGISRFDALAHGRDAAAVALSGPLGQIYLQGLAHGRPAGEPVLVPAEALAALPGGPVIGDGAPSAPAAEGLADPAALIALAAQAEPGARPAPLYIRGPDAALPSEAPPVLLD